MCSIILEENDNIKYIDELKKFIKKHDTNDYIIVGSVALILNVDSDFKIKNNNINICTRNNFHIDSLMYPNILKDTTMDFYDIYSRYKILMDIRFGDDDHNTVYVLDSVGLLLYYYTIKQKQKEKLSRRLEQHYSIISSTITHIVYNY